MKSFVYIEASEEGIDPVSRQIASRIKRIPVQTRGPVAGISIGNHLKGREQQAAGLFDELIFVEAQERDEYHAETVSNILTGVLKEQAPAVLFVPFSHQGMEICPTVGWRLKVPVVTCCTDLNWEGGRIQARRPIFGGRLLASVSMNAERGAVVSVQKGAWKGEVPPQGEGVAVSINPIPYNPAWASRKSQLESITEQVFEDEEDITKSEILVSVGRGIGDPDNLPMMRKLAETLGGIISCSRPVVDAGWLPASRQVGISGKTVAPIIYLALGISGQTNHVAGMDSSGKIIAVNKDPMAPIFNVAHYGVVDDILEFVPELIKQAKERDKA